MLVRIKSLISILSFLFIFLPVSLVDAQDLTIRVLIYQGKEFNISGNSLEISIKNEERITIDKMDRIEGKVNLSDLELNITGKDVSKRFKLTSNSIIEIRGEDISVNGTSYRGSLRLIFRGNNVLIINILLLEEYLYGVVPAEVPYYWPKESLKAQAVLARTFALKSIRNSPGKDYDLDDSQNSQVYRGRSGEYATTNEAVDLTKGEVVLYNGSLASVYFHSTCGGYTESPENVWRIKTPPYLTGIECRYCSDSPWTNWERVIKKEEWKKLVGDGEINIEYDPSVRILKLNGIDGTKIRSTFNLPSTLIVGVEVREKEVIIKGKGLGHGVGVCQWGMKKMAEEGFSYKDIILYYLPGVTIDAYRGL